MTDRVDIDALLIGALYGELTPADEARLTAHLESHPADRTALADLTRTRAAVRESRILAVQLEPPQSVSALLLQEAARRAPRPPREESSWFHRFTRSFMAHPALAAAMTCVIVAGVAGTLYVRHGAKLAEDSASREIAGGAASQPRSEAAAEPATQAPPPVASIPSPTPTKQRFTATAFSVEGRTASGRETRPGMVAADPKVLPLGSRIRVSGAGQYSGEYTVADTGRSIKGHDIDIFIADDAEAKRFGRRTVEVEVLGSARR